MIRIQNEGSGIIFAGFLLIDYYMAQTLIHVHVLRYVEGVMTTLM